MIKLYIIKYKEKNKVKFYTGITNNIEKRMNEHRTGKGAKCLRGRCLQGYAVVEEFDSYREAMKEEKRTKRTSHFFKKLTYHGFLVEEWNVDSADRMRNPEKLSELHKKFKDD